MVIRMYVNFEHVSSTSPSMGRRCSTWELSGVLVSSLMTKPSLPWCPRLVTLQAQLRAILQELHENGDIQLNEALSEIADMFSKPLQWKWWMVARIEKLQICNVPQVLVKISLFDVTDCVPRQCSFKIVVWSLPWSSRRSKDLYVSGGWNSCKTVKTL